MAILNVINLIHLQPAQLIQVQLLQVHVSYQVKPLFT